MYVRDEKKLARLFQQKILLSYKSTTRYCEEKKMLQEFNKKLHKVDEKLQIDLKTKNGITKSYGWCSLYANNIGNQRYIE